MGKTALILSGGGSRGAYQIGVWQALRELGEPIQMVVGASGGGGDPVGGGGGGRGGGLERGHGGPGGF